MQDAESHAVYLHAMHSMVDWFAFTVWRDGKLQRSLSLPPNSGVLEDIGKRLSSELPYWAGNYPAVDPEDEDESDRRTHFPFILLSLGRPPWKNSLVIISRAALPRLSSSLNEFHLLVSRDGHQGSGFGDADAYSSTIPMEPYIPDTTTDARMAGLERFLPIRLRALRRHLFVKSFVWPISCP